MAMVDCVRCRTSVPANQADFSADGMLCRTCAAAVEIAGRAGVPSSEAPDLHALQRALGRSTAKKQVVIGLGGTVLGIAVLMVTGASGSIVVVPGGLLLGGIVTLFRGMTGLAANPT